MGQPAEDYYKARNAAWTEGLVQDFRFGLRTLLKHRSFTVVTILTLALGIAACTAIFTLVNAVLIRSLPYGEPSRLVYIFTPIAHVDLPFGVFGPSNADFFDLKSQSHSFAEMTHFQQAIYNLGVDDRVERIGAAKVDADFFRTLRAAPEVGREIGISDEQPGSERVVVVSHALWWSMFGGRSDVLGSTLRLNGTPYQVIGVMSEDFGFPHKSDLAHGNGHIETTDVWLPSALTPQQSEDRDDFGGVAIARLNPGVTLQAAQTEMSTIMSRLDLVHSDDMRGWSALVKPILDTALGPVRPLMRLLLGAVCFVLLIACADAASLFLARAADRAHELGVRATLGARRVRLIRQMLTESLMLSTASGVLCVGLAFLFLHAILKLDPGDVPRMQDARVDIRVMVFVVFVTVMTSILFGTLPSLSATRIDLGEPLKMSGMRGVAGNRRRVRNGLVIAQVALVVILLTGTGLLVRSYANVLAVHPGFSTSAVTVNIKLNPPYSAAQNGRIFFRELLDAIKHVRGVEAVGAVDYLPLSNTEGITSFELEGYQNQKNQIVELRRVTSDYLATMQIPLLDGRAFTERDDQGQSAVAIVNQAFAKKYFGGASPIQHRVRASTEARWLRIVGVIGDIRNTNIEATPPAQIYTPLWQADTTDQDPTVMSAYLAVRSSFPKDSIVAGIRGAVRNLDPNLAIAEVSTMNDRVSQAVARRRFQTTLLTLFSGIATFLAVVGIYGLLAYSVRQRTAEIGIRMALGSSRIRVARLILQEGLGLICAGSLIGLAAALFSTRLLTGFLYSVPRIDPLTFSLVPALLVFAALVAGLIPSWKASRIDPMNALRHE
jgi:putative ABC transport system permease protein